MKKSDIDKILYTQLIIARMGEKELMNWWNTDIAYNLGGADFLKRLLGDTLAPLAAGEGILKAAQLKDSQHIANIPNSDEVFTLFNPEPEINIAIKERLRHFKRYPEDTPEEIVQILDPNKDWDKEQLGELVSTNEDAEYTGTSFGKEIEKTAGFSIVDVMKNLASIIKTNEKGNYVLSYYVGA
jgi:hypothetical protein